MRDKNPVQLRISPPSIKKKTSTGNPTEILSYHSILESMAQCIRKKYADMGFSSSIE